jgi:hypothetical protein
MSDFRQTLDELPDIGYNDDVDEVSGKVTAVKKKPIPQRVVMPSPTPSVKPITTATLKVPPKSNLDLSGVEVGAVVHHKMFGEGNKQ